MSNDKGSIVFLALPALQLSPASLRGAALLCHLFPAIMFGPETMELVSCMLNPLRLKTKVFLVLNCRLSASVTMVRSLMQ